MTQHWTIGVDIGGTFTDVVAHNPSTGRVHHLKVPTTTGEVAAGFIDGLRALRQEAGVEPDSVRLLLHGTTVATNAIIERNLAKTGLVTTEGFTDVLEIGRHWRSELYDPFFDPPPPLVPRNLRFGVVERLDHQGHEVTALDQHSAAEVVHALREAEVEAVGVVFLHCYRNPKHEQEMAEILRRDDDWFVGTSAELSREVREYERTSTTVLNAALMPLIDRYLRALEQELLAFGVNAPLYITQSNGGALTPEAARKRPATLALSGPVAGVTSCLNIGRDTGHPNLISFDMGGTSTDVSVIQDHAPRVEHQIQVGELPIRLPSVQILSVGAGGGSIASVDTGGALRVGPESAGARPGPACYGHGGQYPTVTDCQLILGRLAADRPLGDRLMPDLDLARQAVQRHVADKLGVSVEEAAAGVIEVANAAMERAVRVALRTRGDDPRDFAMVAFGGAGPLHAAELAHELAIGTVIVPPSPGTLSALGLLSSDVRLDFATSAVHRSNKQYLHDAVAAVFAELESTAYRELRADPRLDAHEATLHRSCDVRYVGQAYEVNVPVAQGEIAEHDVRALLDAFHRAHQRSYGFATPDELCELVTFRIAATVPVQARPTVHWHEGGDPEPVGTRLLRLSRHRAELVALYERTALPVGATVAGPAVIHQSDTTTLLPPDARGEVDAAGNLIVTVH